MIVDRAIWKYRHPKPAEFGALAPGIGITTHSMVEELEQEYTALRSKVHDLQEYL